MAPHRNHQQSTQTGRSRFAARGQSKEERMPEDDSAQKFDEVRSLASQQDTQSGGQDGETYGSGGSYGYGGAFEHGGQRGYQVSFTPSARGHDGEEFREATGGFGYDTEGYQREGIGHPGKNEKRGADERMYGTRDYGTANGAPAEEDARRGYSQDSGYAQSGGDPAQRQGGQRNKKSN